MVAALIEFYRSYYHSQYYQSTEQPSMQRSALIHESWRTGLVIVCLTVGFALGASLVAETPVPQRVEDPAIRSDRYSLLVEQGVDALVKGDILRFRKLLSPRLISRTEAALGTGAIDAIIKDRFIPFFADFVALTDAVETLPTTDVDGYKGLAIFRSFRATDGSQRPFAMYLLDENGQLVVGNLLLNKLLYDVVQAPAANNAGHSRDAK